MALTGNAFLVFVAVLAAIGFGAVVVALPRVSGKRPQSVAARAAMVLALNGLVLFAVGVGLNDQYQFFADWADVHGALFGGQAVTTLHVGAAPAGRAGVSVAPSPTGTLTPSPAPATAPAASLAVGPTAAPAAGSAPAPRLQFTGRRLERSVVGAQSGLTGAVLVTLPQGYDLPANRDRTYPVLETFPGYPGTPAQWPDVMNLTHELDQAVADRAMGPVIVISPQTEFPAGVDTECVDGGGANPGVETWLTHDVPEWSRGALRVRPGRWAAIGLSAGGWCAAMATMLHPDQYSAGVVMGGYFEPIFSPRYKPFSAASERGRRYDLVALAEHAPPPVALWVETSRADTLSYPSTARLLAVAHSPTSVQATVLQHAGHRLGVWSAELPQVLRWLGGAAPAFAA